MEIIIGKLTGFCSGVQRAITGVKEALKENERIYCLGEIIHNPEVVESLKSRGMAVTDDISSIPKRSNFIIRSHGLPSDVIRKAKEKELKIYDFTCPKVKKIHHLVKNLTAEGYHILIIGNPKHPEVQAVLSLTEDNAHVIENSEDFKSLASSEQNAVVVQTTFNPSAFLDITQEIISFTKKTLVYNTLCEETLKRQREAKRLARKVDFIVVAGGKKSSNTKTLYDIVKNYTTAVRIEKTQELDSAWFKDATTVGIISGASTPKQMVKKVYDTLLTFAQ